MGGLLSGAAARAWLVVAAVGLLVIVIVLALSPIPRLSAGQDVLDGVGPGMSEQRVAGARAGIDQVSNIVDLADPLTTTRGGGGAEAPKLVALVASRSGLSRSQVVAVLRREAPHTEALLRALAFSAVRRELPGVKRLIGKTLGLSAKQTDAALAKDLPKLAQVLGALPFVTSGWNAVPNADGATRFAGQSVRSVPDMRDYLSKDVVAVLEDQGSNFRDLQKRNGVGFIPWLLLALGIVVLGYGLVMAKRASGGARGGVAAWAVVPVVGVAVILLVVVLELFPRLDGGDDVRSVREVRDYFKDDLVAAVADQKDHFNDLEDKWPPLTVFPPLLLVVGLIVVLYGRAMTLAARREE